MKRILLVLSVFACFVSSAQLTAPFTESFDNLAIPTGWANTSTNAGANANWKFTGTPGNPSMATSASYVPAVILDHTGNAGGIAWSDGSNPAVADCGLVTDSIDISGLSSLFLEFWIYSNNVFNPSLGNNTMTVNFYDGTTWNTAVWTYSGSASAWQYIGLDLSTYTTSGKVLFEFVLDQTTMVSGFYNDVLLDDISVINVPPCPLPIALPASNITVSTADANWNPGTSATSWKVMWGPTGYNPALAGGLNATATASPYNITGLSSNTIYDYYIIGDCGINGVSDTAGPVSFRTSCASESLGYSNGFENDAINSTPLCWFNYVTNANSNTNVIAFSTPIGTQQTQLSAGNNVVGTDTVMLIAPELLNLSSGNNQVRFFSQTDNAIVELIIGTVSNPTDPSSFSAIDTIRYNNTFTFDEYIVPITLANGYNGTDTYVAFKLDNSGTFQEAFIDDFFYEAVPACGKITGGFVTGVTGTTVTLSFNSSGTTTGYEWGPVGFLQGTGTTDSVPGNPITVGGLSPSTSYDIYIRNDCRAAGSGTSIWSGPFTFTTLCAVLPAPYFQDFESSTVGHWDGIENCWAYDANNPGTTSSGGYSWEIRNTSQTTSGGTGPDRDNTLAPAIGGNFITADVSGSSTVGPDSVMVTSPLVDITSLLVPELSFYYHKHGTNMPDINVDVWSGGVWNRGASIIPGTTHLSPSDPYLKGTLDLSSYGDTVMVRFRVLTTGCCAADVALDDIRIDEQPTCDAPSLLSLVTRTSATGVVNWVPGGSALATNIEYGITGFTPGSGMSIISNDTIDTISGLNSNTTYDVYIYDSCGAGGNSFLVGPITFTTKCLISPTTLPWNDGFEAYAAGPYTSEIDFCNPTYTWEFLPTVSGRLRVAAGALYPKTGTNAFTLDKSAFSSPATSNFLTLNVDLSNYTSAAGIELSFSVLEHLQEPNPDNRVWVKGSNGDPWVQIVDLDQFTISGTYVDIANVDIVNPLANAGQTVGAETQIRFGQAGTTNSGSATCCDGFTFDDVSLMEVTCPTPTGLSANGITDGAANLVWNPTTPSVNYEVWFGPAGFSQGSNTTGGVRVFTGGADSLYVDTLSSNTCYEFLLRYVCAPGDTSIWVGPYEVCTECATYQAPYFETFEGLGTAVGHWDGKNGDCWDFSSNNPGTNSSGGYSWEVRTTAQTTSGTGTGPDRDNTLAPAIGGRFITADVSGSVTAGPDSTILTSPVIDISSLTTPEFQFYYHMHGTGMADLHVDIWNGNSWDRDEIVIIGTKNTSQADPYKDTTYSLASYVGQIDLKVRFRGLTNGCCSGDIAIDDIRISDPISCSKPANLSISNITATGVRFDWDAGSVITSGNYEVSYGVNLASPSAGISSIQSGDSLILSNLTNATIYCYFVREVCSPGDSSAWAGPICFQTLCLNQTLPYGENFNLNEGCMTLINNSPTPVGWEPQPAGGSNQVGDLDGTGYMIADSDQHANGIHMIVDMETPIIDASTMTSGNLLLLEFDQYFNAITAGSGDSATVEVFDGTTWNIVYSTSSSAGAFGGPDQQSIDITAYANANLQVRFQYNDNNQWAWYWAVDNLLISEQNPGCTAPSALFSSQVDCNQIELTWTSNSGGSIIEYGAAGFVPGTGTYTNITTSPVFVTALMPLTSYDFYVADTCGNDTSSWFGPFNETTIACPVGCINPTGLDTVSTTCLTADLTWVSGSTTIASAVEWGPTGYLPGTGTAVGNAANPLPLAGLSPGTSYDFYVIDFCTTDTSGVSGPFTFTTRSGPISADFTAVAQPSTLTNAIVDVDATNSQGASTYTWDWGDGTPATTVSSSQTFHSYTANGGYNIKLIVTGDCGVDSMTVLMNVAGISLAENALGRSLSLYPNPTAGSLNLSFETTSGNAIISIMDLSGKTLRSIDVNGINGEYRDQLDISEFAKGSYILRIESGDLTVQRRMIKK